MRPFPWRVWPLATRPGCRPSGICPDYVYDPETYEYGPYSTTDPCYIEDGVRLSPNAYHDEFLTATKANLLRFLELTGQVLPITREVSVWNLPDLPLARQSRRRLEPDLGVWPAGTRVRRESMLQWEEVGLPRLVRRLEPETAVQAALLLLEGTCLPGLQELILVQDGKVSRRSGDRATGTRPLLLVSAFLGRAGLTLAQEPC